MPMTYTPGDNAARAKADADLRYGAKETTLRQAIQALAGAREADMAGINMYGDQGRQGINASFDQLAQNLATNRQLANRDLGIATEAVGQGYRDAARLAEAARAASADRLAQMAAQNSAYSTVNLAEPASAYENLATQIASESAMNDANFTGNLRNWSAQQNALMQAAEAGGERDRANRLSGFEAELLRAVAEAKNMRSKQEFDYNVDLLGLLGERGAFQSSRVGELGDADFAKMLEANKFNLSEQGMLLDAQYKQAQLAQAAEEMQLRAAMARAENDRQERALAAQQASQSKDDYWKMLEYDLKKQGMSQAEAEWLAQQEQQAFANRMGMAEFLGGNPNADRDAIMYDLGLSGNPGNAARIGAGKFGSDAMAAAKGLSGGGSSSGFLNSLKNWQIPGTSSSAYGAAGSFGRIMQNPGLTVASLARDIWR